MGPYGPGGGGRGGGGAKGIGSHSGADPGFRISERGYNDLDGYHHVDI